MAGREAAPPGGYDPRRGPGSHRASRLLITRGPGRKGHDGAEAGHTEGAPEPEPGPAADDVTAAPTGTGDPPAPPADAAGEPGREPIGLQHRLELNRMGSFDWDLERGTMHLDPAALRVFDLRPEEHDGTPLGLAARVPTEEGERLDAAVVHALQENEDEYGAYFRVHDREGTPHWAHSQGHILRDAHRRPYRIIGIVREATTELDDSTLLRSLQEGRQRQTLMVQQFTTALSRALSVSDVTQVVAGPGGPERFGAAALVLGLVEHEHFEILAVTGIGDPPEELMDAPMDVDLPLSEAALTRRPLFVGSRDELVARYPQLEKYQEQFPVGGAALLPLVAQDRVLGALGLLHDEYASYTAEDRNLALALAGAVAQSLQRAMLFDYDREFVRGLQETMLPNRIPAVGGGKVTVRYRAARTGREVGGDWYDVIPLPQGRTGFVVGDVQGHDTHASAVMGQLRIALRAYAGEGHPPETVLVRASRFLSDLETDRFATCTYAEADLKSGMLRVARAGHMGPLLSHGAGLVNWPATEGGLPLGIATDFEEDHFPETQLYLEPGSTLLLCTDGLVEQPGRPISAGIDALAQAVRHGPREVESLADHLSESLWAQHGSEDDMALLLLHRLPVPGAPATHRVRMHIHQADPSGISEVRAAVRQGLAHWQAGYLADNIEIATTEMINNALTHTESGALMSMELLPGSPDLIRLEVEDRSSYGPRRRRPGPMSTSGRGLMLIEAVADRWGSEPRGQGKAVWCEFALPEESAQEEAGHQAPEHRSSP